MEMSDKILQEDGVEIEQIEDDSNLEDIVQPFDPKKIDITTKQMILESIFRRLRNNEIDLNTFFQRGGDLWNKTKQSRLIESILIKLPLPAFYFDGSDDDNWLVVDGLQRLSVFKNYIIDKNFPLQNLEYIKKFNRYCFDDLPRELQRRIEEHEITVYIINPGTPKEVKFNLFKRINTGGLILTAQEIRHALNQGISTEFINELAELEEFKRYGINPKRMVDKDFITRFVAFYIHNYKEYKYDLDAFLNDSMAELKNFSVEKRQQIKADFKKALQTAFDIFGNYAYRKLYVNNINRKNPFNKALFETWNIALCRLKEDKIKTVIAKKDILKENFVKLLNEDKEFQKSITVTGYKREVVTRFSAIENLIKEVLND